MRLGLALNALLAPALMTCAATASRAEPAAPAALMPPALTPVVTSNLVFNGVATTSDGQVFLSYPRQDRARGIEVGRLVGGAPQPLPSAAWNSWAPGRDGRGVFVWAKALRIGPDRMRR